MAARKKRVAAYRTARSGLTPRERHVRICAAARAIKQGTEYAALLKRGYGHDEITKAREMLGLGPNRDASTEPERRQEGY